MKSDTRTPRTLSDAFPQFPGPLYVEPSTMEKILDVISVIAAIGLLLIFAVLGSVCFLGV